MRMIKTIVFIIIFTFLGLMMPGDSRALDAEFVIDSECQAYMLLKSPDDVAKCNVLCEITCVDSGKHCAPNLPESCITLDLETAYPGIKPTFSSAVNIYGIDLCPTTATGGEDDPYCTMILVRLFFYAFLSVIIFVSMVMGLLVVWERSTAADNPEKVEKAVARGKNIVVGLVIVFVFLGVVQVSALLLGLTGSLFDISIVPQPLVLTNGEVCSNRYAICGYGICKKDPSRPGTTLYCYPP